jgi:two-component system, sensor histidine kinase LadS
VFTYGVCGRAFLQRMLRLILLLGATAAGLAAAQPPDPSPALSGLGNIAAQYWTDPTGNAPLEAARTAFERNQGRPADPTQVMPLAGGAAVWYQLRLPQVAAPEQAVLTVPIPGIKSVELFHLDDAGGWRSQRSGDAIAVDEWPVRYLHPAFALTLRPDETQPTYLRIQNSHPVRVKWQLRDAGNFLESAKQRHLALGVYVGFMVLVLLLSIANAASWRDTIHVYYAVHVVLVGLSVLSLTGLAGEYLWPGNAWWNDTSSILIPAVSVGWAALFVRELVAERGAWIVSWSLLALTAYSFLMAIAFVMLGRESFYRAPGVYAAPVMAAVVGVLAWYSRRRPEVGLWVLTGMAVMVAGAMVPLMHNLGWLPASFVTRYGVQIGAALEIPLVLVGLYFRSRERRDNRVRLEALSRTDPLTGVGNQRVLMERLGHLLGRSRRDSLLGAVLRVHVANLDAIRKQHGREVAAAAMVQAAECVTREAAETDTVAREDSGDLVLVLEGQVTHAHAAYAARNIVANGLQFSNRLPQGVTLKLRVGGARAPLPHVDAPALLGMLHRAILDVARDPQKRALRFLDSQPPSRSAQASVETETPTPESEDELVR